MAYQKGGKQPHQKARCERIAARVKKLAPTCTVPDVFAAIQSYQNAPRSMTTFYKYYRQDLEEAKASITQKIGDKVIHTALNGEEENPLTHKAREFYLDRKGGWSKKETHEHRDVGSEEEENEGAVKTLMASLGFSDDSDEESLEEE